MRAHVGWGFVLAGVLAFGLFGEIVVPIASTQEEDAPKLTDEQQAIADLFTATKVTFGEKGTIRLEYDLKSMDDGLLEDWRPAKEKSKRTIRWAERWDEGLMVAMTGNWTHKAIFAGDVETHVDARSYSLMREGDYFTLGLVTPKGKTMVGTNLGKQCLRLVGTKIARAIPTKFPKSTVRQDLKFGMRIKEGVLYALRGKSTAVNSRESTKFMKKVDKGRIGFRWKGQVQMCLYKVTIEGKLDEAWLAKARKS